MSEQTEKFKNDRKNFEANQAKKEKELKDKLAEVDKIKEDAARTASLQQQLEE